MSYKVPAATLAASKELCSSLVDALGGPIAVGKKMKWAKQYIHRHARYVGHMPLNSVYEMSKIFGVPVWALAYHRFLKLLGPDNMPTIRQVIRDVDLLPGEKARILSILEK